MATKTALVATRALEVTVGADYKPINCSVVGGA